MKWMILIKEKSDVSKEMIKLINIIKYKHGRQTKFIRCDNAGENLAFERDFKDHTSNLTHLQFEFTARDTPTQNGKVERAVSTLYGRVRSCNNAAGFNRAIRNGLWDECARHCTMMDNILYRGGRHESPIRKFTKKDPLFVNEMRIFEKQKFLQ